MTEYCIQYTQNKMNCLDKVLICITVHNYKADGLYTVEYVNGEFRNFLYETLPKGYVNCFYILTDQCMYSRQPSQRSIVNHF